MDVRKTLGCFATCFPSCARENRNRYLNGSNVNKACKLY